MNSFISGLKVAFNDEQIHYELYQILMNSAQANDVEFIKDTLIHQVSIGDEVCDWLYSLLPEQQKTNTYTIHLGIN